jgi:DNA polymerase-3 subunit epsilon
MDTSEAEAALRHSPDFRILQRVPPIEAWPRQQNVGDIRRAVFVDTETTGLDPETDEVIEIALLPFDYDRASGSIVRIDPANAYASLREPSRSIPPQSTAIHGISDQDVRGQVVDVERLEKLVNAADIVIAHNAAFDRPMVEKHWSIFERKSWACSLLDIDWRAEGLTTGKLDYLLMRMGWFYEGHRAMIDAEAGVFLLIQSLPQTRRSALSALLENARRPLRAVRAEETAFEQRAALRQRGYRWDPGDGDQRSKAWWILTDDPASEIDWLNKQVYRTPREVPIINMPATKRYSAHLWS